MRRVVQPKKSAPSEGAFLVQIIDLDNTKDIVKFKFPLRVSVSNIP